MRRVVITGLGVVSCLGNNQEEVHQSLLNSKSGISYAEDYKEHNLKSHVGDNKSTEFLLLGACFRTFHIYPWQIHVGNVRTNLIGWIHSVTSSSTEQQSMSPKRLAQWTPSAWR